MVKLVFKGIKPVSLNSAYYRNRKLTTKSRIFRATFLTQLQPQLPQIKDIQSRFDPLIHCLLVSYTFYTPNAFFFTKKGAISNRSQDLDNCLKLITDFTFNDKYDNDWLHSKTGHEASLFSSLDSLSNVAIDDRFIQELRATKLPSDDYAVEITISIKDLPLK